MDKLVRSKFKTTMINKYMRLNPGFNEQQAEEAWRKVMKAHASKGGKNSSGYEFGHGKVDPRVIGSKGGKAKKK